MLKSSKAKRWYFIYVLCVASGSFFDLNLGARVPLSEILAFTTLPFLGVHIDQRFNGDRLKRVKLIFWLWLLGIVVSDVVNATALYDFLRSVMKPIFAYLWFLFFYTLIKRCETALQALPIGWFLAAVQNYFLPQSWTAGHGDSEGYESLAFTFFPLVNSGLVAIAIMQYKRSILTSSFVLIGIAVFNALMGGSRSPSLLIALTAAAFYIKPENININKLMTVPALVGFVIALSAVYYGYIYAAPAGWLGDYQAAKFAMQTRGIFGDSPLGLLLAGRPEVYAAILAIMDNPIFGYGSWSAHQMASYFHTAIQQVGINISPGSQSLAALQGGRVGHSIILALWLENSILAFIAMLLAAKVLFSTLRDALFMPSLLRPIILYSVIAFTWTFFLSPFSVDARMMFGFVFALYVLRYPIAFGPISLPRAIA